MHEHLDYAHKGITCIHVHHLASLVLLISRSRHVTRDQVLKEK